MKPYIVAYDLLKPEDSEDYKVLFDQFKGMDAQKIQLSMWLVASNDNAKALLAHFKSFVDENDRLWVAELVDNHAWNKSFNGTKEWLKSNPCSR